MHGSAGFAMPESKLALSKSQSGNANAIAMTTTSIQRATVSVTLRV